MMTPVYVSGDTGTTSEDPHAVSCARHVGMNCGAVRGMSFKSMTFGCALAALTLITAAPSSRASVQDDLTAEQHLDIDMIAASREQCGRASAALAELSDALRTTKQMQDVTQMKAALDRAQTQLLQVHLRLGSCGDILKLLATTPGRVATQTSATTSTGA